MGAIREACTQFLSSGSATASTTPTSHKGRPKMSAEHRAKLSESQKKRQAEKAAATATTTPTKPTKKTKVAAAAGA